MDAIGRFRIIRQLGGGGFGEVYLAEDPSIGRKVAIKVFRPRDENVLAFATSSDEEALQVLRQRFLKEAQILASLEDEPFVVNVHEYGEDHDGAPFYVMPYLPHSLADELGEDIIDIEGFDSHLHGRRPRALPMARALELIEQMLAGLAAAHDRGLIHRDIKPSNLMFSRAGDIRIVDFGIAKVPDSPHSTVSHLGIGSRNYIAPEQRQSAKHVDARADVYAAGVVAYRMLTGRLPVGRFPDPIEMVPGLGKPLNDLILAMMAISREQRPADANAALSAFRSAQSGVGAVAVEAPTRVFGSDATTAAVAKSGAAAGKPKATARATAGARTLPRWLAVAVPLVLVLTVAGLVLWLTGDEQELADEPARVQELPRDRPVAQTLRDHLQTESNDGNVMFEAIPPRPDLPEPSDPASSARSDAAVGGAAPMAPGPIAAAESAPQHRPGPEAVDTADEPAAAALAAVDRRAAEQQQRVRAIQQELRRLGQDVSVDGQMGPATAAAIRAFEQALGEQPSGLPSAELLEQLAAAPGWPEAEEPDLAEPAEVRAVGEVFSDCPNCPEMVVIGQGRFRMGSPPNERQRRSSEGPQREVTVPSFALGTRSVTFAQFDACVDAGGCSESPHDRRWGRGSRPVINVSWHDAREYVTWLSATTGQRYRLPSEAEWEYAARAGTDTRFHTGDCIISDQANFNGLRQPRGCPRGSVSNRTSFAGAYEANAWGLYDMHGNVADFVADCWNDNYEGAPVDGSAWLQGDCSQAIHRGGAWFLAGDTLRSASRITVARDYRNFYLGFRVARDLED